jgi:hypothetical protein
MTLDAMTFASGIRDEILNHQLTDEYAAALLAMQRGEPQARARVLDAYTHLRARAATECRLPETLSSRVGVMSLSRESRRTAARVAQPTPVPCSVATDAGERGDHPSAASAASLSWRAAWPKVARLPFTV